MATGINIQGTELADVLTYNINGNYMAAAGDDVIVVSKGVIDVLDAGEGADTVTVKNGTVRTLNLGVGNDIIIASKGTVDSLNLGGGNDRVTVNGCKVTTLNTSDGDNVIVASKGTVTTINCGSGDDSVTASGAKISTINMGSGNNVLVASKGKIASVSMGAGNDRATVSGATVSNMNMGAGNNVLVASKGKVASVNMGAGNDSATVSGATVTNISMGSGNNVLVASKGKITSISMGAGNDAATVSGATVSNMNMGSGNNVLVASKGKIASVSMGADNDNATVSGATVTNINMGAGNDTLVASKGKVSVDMGEGDDKVTASGATIAKLSLGAGNDVANVSGGKITTMNLGSGNDVVTISNGTVTTLNLNSGNNVINYNGGTLKTINWGSGVDTLNVRGTKLKTINGSASQQIVNLYAGTFKTVNLGAGDDTLNVAGAKVTKIDMGAGHDNVTIDWKSGLKVTLVNSGNAAKDSDNLVITNANTTDFAVSLNKGALVLKHSNGSTLTINNWANNTLNKVTIGNNSYTGKDVASFIGKKLAPMPVVNVASPAPASVGSAATVNSKMITSSVAQPVQAINTVEKIENHAVSIMHTFMSSLDNTTKSGFAAVDEAVKNCSYGLYNSLDNLVKSFIKDAVNHSGSTTAQRKAFLNEYCGINLDNDDTGAITGFDATGKTVKTAETIVSEPAGMNVNDFTYNPASFKNVSAVDVSGIVLYENVNFRQKENFYGATVNGVTFYWNENNWSDLGVDTSVCKQIVGGVINAWADASFDLIEESYGLKLNDPNSNLQKLDDGTVGIQLILTNDKSTSSIASVGSCVYKDTTYETMNINLRYYQNGITNVNGNSSSAGAGYLDRVLSHELTHAAMAANIKDFIELPLFIKEGAAELVHGIDDERTSSILTMVNTGYKATATSNGVSTTLDMEGLLTKVFDLNNSGYKYSTYSYAGGYMLLRYLAKTVDDYVATKDVAFSGASVSNYEAEPLKQVQNAELSFCDSSCLSEAFVDYSSNNSESLKIFGNC